MAAPMPQGQPVAAVRPYRDFLTPSLHRRFTSAALVGLAACWTEATLMSSFHVFWSWFPLGLTGIRTLLLFLCPLSVFILRVAQLHVGARTTTSSLRALWLYGLSVRAVWTLFTYMSSAWWFSEVYIWTYAQSANLAWVDAGRSYERPRLNERPVMFRSMFLCLATAQAALHLYRDYDRVAVPSGKTESTQQGQTSQASAEATTTVSSQAQAAAKAILQRALPLVICVWFVGPIIYFTLLRQTAWTLALSIGRTMYSLPKASKPSGLTNLIDLLGRYLFAGFFLTVLWEVSNQAFTIFAAQEPLKKGKPLTTDSRDPNGSLIAGLKAKKEVARSMAFWELFLISTRFDDRRVSLYQDLNRKNGSTWSQISSLCMAEIQAISRRCQEAQQPTSPPDAAQQQQQQSQQILRLPRIAQPLNQDNILNGSAPPNSRLEAVAGGVGTLAKSYGQSPQGNQVGSSAQKLLEFSASKVLTPEQQANLKKGNLTGQANNFLMKIVRSPLGAPFRQSFKDRVIAVVFGSPLSNANTIAYAVGSLTRLAVCSIKEDSLGQVSKDIAGIVRLLTTTIQSVQNLVATLPPHWTDVGFDKNNSRNVKEVDDLLDTLKGDLQDVILAFGEYADSLGLSRMEVRVAKEMVRGMESEMVKVGKSPSK